MKEKFRRCGWLLVIAAAAALLLLNEKNRPQYATETALESRLKQLVSHIDGVGEVQVLINQDPGGAIIGVCVLSGAADDVAAVFRIQRAVGAALGIENERIEVIRMEEDLK